MAKFILALVVLAALVSFSAGESLAQSVQSVQCAARPLLVAAQPRRLRTQQSSHLSADAAATANKTITTQNSQRPRRRRLRARVARGGRAPRAGADPRRRLGAPQRRRRARRRRRRLGGAA